MKILSGVARQNERCRESNATDQFEKPDFDALMERRALLRGAAIGRRLRYSSPFRTCAIRTDTWYHIAIVNDPVKRETILYVEGSLMLRNVSGEVGIATLGADRAWVVGATWWNGFSNDGYFGNIGEMRLVSKPLPPSPALWLALQIGQRLIRLAPTA